MNSKDILTRVFEITQDPRDGILFLNEFKSISPESFALLFADSETIMDSSGVLFSDIKLLHQLDLFPVVVIEEDSYHYIKVFFPQTGFQNEDSKFGIGFPYSLISKENLLLEVKDSISRKKIPVLLWNKETDEFIRFLKEIKSVLHSNKVILVNSEGPLREENSNKVISLIQSGEALEKHKTNVTYSTKNKIFLSIAESLVSDSDNPKFSVVLTSPYTILRELFTVKGSGTLVKKKNKISKYESVSEIDKDKVFSLIESSFSKSLKPSFLESKFDVLYLEESYQGCAWLEKTEFGFLLSKFAVNGIARGAGVGRDIWDILISKNTPLFWRSKPGNNINKWYMNIAQGLEKDENWFYYWLGLNSDLIPKVILHLKNQPEDFYPGKQT
ncbi:acetylglutamate kinase [Leptospira ilyithenensis]|uniref:Acetylglutamate kinase n=1 Tax=Leptospira ilyithenensis TaxID=2484901 RepID=A0A4R9LQX9_9LEPT|nr:acetylglutamate kinase [Leptospira ilyithenensis]TGN08380.1 acetylglutamate kinase [Leptospira ilyithenensis]